ncbi:hypothetical protein BU16DRAFT_528840 [Lophium mytilinum]|uniref:RRM domain-containing protein n=1 Tax=Lophium mytilinum TaxID=390894 RepID=A0A6A6QN54_9PEZI|nr:hypothetical protein BU16DRAFT_528840 [Lophium mytilinum]
MDINSLLSPQESPVGDTPPPPRLRQSPMSSPLKRPQRQAPPRRTSSTLSQQITSSPHSHVEPMPSSTLTHNSYHTHLAMGGQLPSPGLSSVNGRAGTIHSAASTPPIDARGIQTFDTRMTPPQPPLSRHTSTPGMDTLADLASMQQQQQAVPHSASGAREAQAHPPTRPPMTLENLPRSLSGNSAKELQMAAQDNSPRVFKAASLTSDECDSLNTAYDVRLKEPTNYWNNKGFVEALYAGFKRHTEEGERRPAGTYEHWSDLKEAFEQICSIYSLGEDFYCNWIDFKLKSAYSTQDRLALIEFCKTQALKDEPRSVKVWVQFGNMLYDWYLAANNLTEEGSDWSPQEQQDGQNIFTWAEVREAWEQAGRATGAQLKDSHLVFNRWMAIQEAQYEENPQPNLAISIVEQYEARLTRAHAQWEETRELYKRWVSVVYADDMPTYEEKMQAVHHGFGVYARANNAYKYRKTWDDQIESKIQEHGGEASGDEYNLFVAYLRHEMRKEGVFSFDTITALFDRAVLRFPYQHALWLDYVEYLIKKNEPTRTEQVLQEAVRHAPWCGALWAHKILHLEIAGFQRAAIEDVKNQALKTGVLDVGDMEDLIQLFIAFCGFLRRAAFNTNTTNSHNASAAHAEEPVDEAELAIISAMEHVNEVGIKQFAKYDQQYPGDPQFRLEKIKIKLLTQQGRIDDARKAWADLKSKHHGHLDFWSRWYTWELVMWPVPSGPSFGILSNQPLGATAVLAEALNELDTIDNPAEAVRMYRQHCEQHENASVVQHAMIVTRDADTKVAERLAREAPILQESAPPEQQASRAQVPIQTTEVATPSVKRKRTPSPAPAEEEDESSKKPKMNPNHAKFLAQHEQKELEKQKSREALEAGRQVFVRGLPFKGFEPPDLADFLGLPEENVNHTGVGHARAYCFGTYDTPQDAEDAVARLNGTEFFGRTLEVKIATPKGREVAAGFHSFRRALGNRGRGQRLAMKRGRIGL